MSLSISNCKETQFKAANKDNESTMNTDDPNNGVTSWGVTTDHGGVWYHIAVVSDGTNVVTYTNGAKAFRNINKNGNGLYADPTDGRFRIGSSYYNDTFDTSQYNKDDFDKFLRGNLQEVRFSRGALAQATGSCPTRPSISRITVPTIVSCWTTPAYIRCFLAGHAECHPLGAHGDGPSHRPVRFGRFQS